jgi:HlyD family secretion protein
MSRQVFRKVALDRLSSPEQLDQLVKITTPSGWLALVALALLLVMLLAWAVFGTVPSQVSGPAILIETGDDGGLEAVMYVPLADGNKLAPGMEVEVQVAPSMVGQEAYGFMLGRVVSVGTFPLTYEGLVRTVGSDDLVQALNVGTAPIEVHIELVPDDSTVSGFQWSSPEGPPTTVESGTLGTATVMTGEQHPIRFVLPSR